MIEESGDQLMELYCSRAGSKDRSGKLRDSPAFQHIDAALFPMTKQKWGACLTPASDDRVNMSISSPPAPPSRDASTASTPTPDNGVPDIPLPVRMESDGEQVNRHGSACAQM